MKKIKYTADTMIGDKTLAKWDKEWVDMPGGFAVPHSSLGRQAGLYRAVLGTETLFIGKGAGVKNRLAARLYDLRRPGDSGRRYSSGKFIYENRTILDLKLLITGDNLAACEIADRLAIAMIKFHSPTLKVPEAIVRQIAFG